MTTYAPPEVHVRRPHVGFGLAALALAAIVVAGIVGYAIAGGFTTESASGQDVADRVAKAWATGDAAAIAAAYGPAAVMVLDADTLALDAKELTEAIKGAISIGNTYKQIGPVVSHEAEDGDTYVASLVEVRGPAHPDGAPMVGFYRVRDGKVIRHVFIEAEQY